MLWGETPLWIGQAGLGRIRGVGAVPPPTTPSEIRGWVYLEGTALLLYNWVGLIRWRCYNQTTPTTCADYRGGHWETQITESEQNFKKCVFQMGGNTGPGPWQGPQRVPPLADRRGRGRGLAIAHPGRKKRTAACGGRKGGGGNKRSDG